jgi:hypothetical protein
MEANHVGKVVQVETAKLEGEPLSFAVAVALGIVHTKYACTDATDNLYQNVNGYAPWRNWTVGGSLMDKFHPTYTSLQTGPGEFHYCAVLPGSLAAGHGPTHLIALCRAIVLALSGPLVDIPQELTGQGSLDLKQPQDAPQDVTKAAQDKPQGKPNADKPENGPQDIAKAPTDAQKAAHKAKQPPGKPLPQGKQAQAAKAHAEAQAQDAKGKGKQ